MVCSDKFHPCLYAALSVLHPATDLSLLENEIRVSDELDGLPQVRGFPDAPQDLHRLGPRPRPEVAEEFVELRVLVRYPYSMLQVGGAAVRALL